MSTAVTEPGTTLGARSDVHRVDDALAVLVAVDVDVSRMGRMGPSRGRRAGDDARLRLPVRIGPGRVAVGPVSSPGEPAPCGECLDRRMVELRPAEEQAAIAQGRPPRSLLPDGQLSDAAVRHVCLLAEHLLRRPPDGSVLELTTATLHVRLRGLLPHSGCGTCATPELDDAHLVLQPGHVPKRATDDLRGRSLAEFVLPETTLVNDLCGVVGAKPFTVYQCSASLPVSGFFRVRSRFAYHEMWWSGQLQSRAASLVAGLLEGLERHAGQFPRSRSTTVRGARSDLVDVALDPRRFGEYSEPFYASHGDSYVRFRDDLTMPWVWGYSFARQEPVLVPEQLVYYLDRTSEPKFVQECSSGCATGSTTQEATVFGLLELIERDAFLLNWVGGTSMPEIEPDSCEAADVQFVIDRIARLGYRVRFFDLRVDVPVPTVLAVAERVDGGVGRLCFAAGSAFSPIDAVRGALSEVASYVPGLDERTTARRGELREMTADWSKVTELTHHSLLYGLPEMRDVAAFVLDALSAPVALDVLHADWDAIRPHTLDLHDDVTTLVRLVHDVGGDVVVVDQTTPEQRALDVSTVAVLSDGLLPIDFGWQRQRVFGHPRLAAYLAGQLADRAPETRGPRRDQPNYAPHPFP